jgi:hypothetical protein
MTADRRSPHIPACALQRELLPPSGVARRRIARALATLPALLAPGLAWLPAAPAHAQNQGLPNPRSIKALLAQAGRDRRPIVAMFSIHGCPWCAAIRREQLNGLFREESERGVRVVEFDLADETAFDDAGKATPSPAPPAKGSASPSGVAGARAAPALVREAASPAALARLLGVKIAPTLVFLGPDGEIAERLVGYGSPDFFSAYLDDRIDAAKRAIGGARRAGAG